MCVFGRGMLTGPLHSIALDIYVKILLLLILVVVVVVEIVVLSMPSLLFSSTFINEFY
jgi:hypothetical protein